MVRDTSWKFDKAIFDPSLLSPPSQMLLGPIAKHTKLLLTKRMFDIFPPEQDHPRESTMNSLLKLWGITKEKADSVTRYNKNGTEGIRTLFRLQDNQQLDIVELDSRMEDIRTHTILGLLRDAEITNDPLILDFISDEICLALQNQRSPIFCIETSSWKIVEIIKKIGAKAKREIVRYGERKYEFLEDNWLEVLATSLGFAAVFLVVNPIDAVIHHGFELVHYMVVDP